MMAGSSMFDDIVFNVMLEKNDSFLAECKKLFEVRNSASLPYYRQIKGIVDYIVSQFDVSDSGKEIEVPESLTDKLVYQFGEYKFVDELYITVTFKEYKPSKTPETDCDWGAGEVGLTDIYENGTIECAEISITGYYTVDEKGNAHVLEHTLYNNLFHEIGHLLYDNKQIKKYNKKYGINQGGADNTVQNKRQLSYRIFTNIYNRLLDEGSIRRTDNAITFRQMLYRLFCEHEINALVDGTMGTLISKGYSKNDFLKAVKETSAYKIYTHYLTRYEDAVNSFSDDELELVLDAMIDSGLVLKSKKTKNLNRFRKFLLTYVKDKLDYLKSRIWRVASTYFQKKSEGEFLEEYFKKTHGMIFID